MRQIVARDLMEKKVYKRAPPDRKELLSVVPLTFIPVFRILHSENLAGWLRWFLRGELDVHHWMDAEMEQQQLPTNSVVNINLTR